MVPGGWGVAARHRVAGRRGGAAGRLRPGTPQPFRHQHTRADPGGNARLVPPSGWLPSVQT
jgi:hypothetical protein